MKSYIQKHEFKPNCLYVPWANINQNQKSKKLGRKVHDQSKFHPSYQESFGHTLEPVALSIRGGEAKLLSGADLLLPRCNTRRSATPVRRCETLSELFQPNARDPMF